MPRPLVLLALIVASVLTMIYGPASLVEARLPGGLPVGTLLAIVAFVAGAAIPLGVGRPRSALWWAGVLGLAAGLAWYPLGVALSGSAALNFVNDAADSALFWGLTRWIAGYVLAAMAWAAGALAVRWWQERKRAAPSVSA